METCSCLLWLGHIESVAIRCCCRHRATDFLSSLLLPAPPPLIPLHILLCVARRDGATPWTCKGKQKGALTDVPFRWITNGQWLHHHMTRVADAPSVSLLSDTCCPVAGSRSCNKSGINQTTDQNSIGCQISGSELEWVPRGRGGDRSRTVNGGADVPRDMSPLSVRAR